jgi:hypothetical protein
MTGDVRALSLKQPWPWVIFTLGKNIENRTKFLGLPKGIFYIHVSASETPAYFRGALIWMLQRNLLSRMPPPSDIIRGAIVGRARVERILRPTPTPTETWHMADCFGYVLVDVEPIPPVPCKGKLGFWKIPSPVLEQLGG